MSEWTKQPIKELLDGQWPGEWGSEPDLGLPSVVVYRSTDLDDAGHLLEDGGAYRFIPPIKLNAKKLVAGDILIEASGGAPDRPVGRAAQFAGSRGESAIGANFLRTLRPKKTVCASFLRWALVALQQQSAIWRYQQQTTGMINLKVSDYLNHLIDTPPLQEQLRIAEILSTMDEAIEQTEALIAKYQQIKAGLMHDLFTRGLSPEASAKGDVTWTLRPTRTQAPHLYRESPFGWIPKEWEVKPLRDIATYQHGQPFPSTDYSDEGVLLLRPGNLHVSGVVRFDATHTTRIPQQWLRDCPELTVKQNDIVMNLTAQSLEDQFLGRVCIVKDGELSLLNQRIARFFPRQVDHHFLYWILRSRQFRNQIDRTAQGTKVQHIYNSDLNRVMFAIPKSQQEQERVAGLLLTATELLVTGESSIAKLRQQKHGLMHDLLTGRVRVKVAETASI